MSGVFGRMKDCPSRNEAEARISGDESGRGGERQVGRSNTMCERRGRALPAYALPGLYSGPPSTCAGRGAGACP